MSKKQLEKALAKAKKAENKEEIAKLELLLSPNDEAVNDEAVNDETETKKITDSQKTIVEKTVSEFLATKNVKVIQSIDHCKAYTEACEVISANLPDYTDFLADPPNDNESGFDLVQKWFNRLGFEEIMLSKSLYENQQTLKSAKYKKPGNVRSQLRSFLNDLNFDKFDQITDSEAKTLLSGQLFLTGSTSTGDSQKGMEKSPLSWGTETNKAKMFFLFQESGEYSWKEIVNTYDAAKVGTTTAQDQFNMIKRQCKASGYGELSKSGDTITMKKTA